LPPLHRSIRVGGGGKWLRIDSQLVETISRLGELGKTQPGKFTQA